jgi:hypothetical protein
MNLHLVSYVKGECILVVNENFHPLKLEYGLCLLIKRSLF